MKEALEILVPSPAEKDQVQGVVKEFLTLLNKQLKESKAIVGGSTAKDTWLTGNHDVDIFIQFPYKEFSAKSAQLSDIVEPQLQATFPKTAITRLHGSRDYFQVTYKKQLFELVPILKITKAEEAKNITDISPLHAAWVNTHAKGKKGDILLAKQFCKAAKVYGAESYIAGFSGYVIEILISYYGSFEKFIQAVVTWKEKVIIDPSNFYKKGNVLFHLNTSKTKSPLILIDPVDRSRNAAAAISKKRFLQLQEQAKAYLKNPQKDFFQEQKVTLTELRKLAKKQNLVYIEVIPLTGKKDVVGMKLKKSFTFLRRSLAPFGVIEADWDWNKMWFILKKKTIPEVSIHKGPPITMLEAAKNFKKKHKEAFVDKGLLFAKVKEPHPKIEAFFSKLLKNSYITERIEEIKKVEFS